MGIVSIDPLSIVITIANLFILYFILRKFLMKPVQRVLDERSRLIEEEKEKAEKANDDAAALKSEYDSKVASLEAMEKEKMTEASRNAVLEYDRILKDASEKADRIISDAQKKAEMEEKSRKAETDREIADIVTKAAGKIAAGNSSAELDRSLYDEFLKKAGEGNE